MQNKIIFLSIGLIFHPFISVFSQCNEEFAPKGVVADTTYKVNFKDYEGFIFPENYHGYMADKEVQTFRLSLKEVKLIEKTLLEQFNYVHLNDQRVSSNYQPNKNLKSTLKKYDRQYLGYINEQGDKCAKIILTRRKGKGKQYFDCFDKIMVIGFGKFYEKNQRYFIVNLAQEKLVNP